MKKINSNKRIIIALLIVLVVVLLVTVTATRRNQGENESGVQRFVNDIMVTSDKIVAWPIHKTRDFVGALQYVSATYEENQRLKKQLDEFENMRSENIAYKQENEQLKDQLALDATLSNFERINASVIDRSPDTWQNILIIDKGSQDGIGIDMPVMGSKGLIGRILSVNEHSAKVELLTTSNQNANHFPVMILPKEGDIAYGILSEYDEEEDALVIKQLTSAVSNVQPGDEVTTSGLGGKSPRGLYVGTVKAIKDTDFGLEKEVYVTPGTPTYDLTAVTVIKRLAGSDES